MVKKEVVSALDNIQLRYHQLQNSLDEDFSVLNQRNKMIYKLGTDYLSLYNSYINAINSLDKSLPSQVKDFYDDLTDFFAYGNSRIQGNLKLFDLVIDISNKLSFALKLIRQNLISLRFMVINLHDQKNDTFSKDGLTLSYCQTEMSAIIAELLKQEEGIRIHYTLLTRDLENEKKRMHDYCLRLTRLMRACSAGFKVFESHEVFSDIPLEKLNKKINSAKEVLQESVQKVVTWLQYHDIIRQKMAHMQIACAKMQEKTSCLSEYEQADASANKMDLPHQLYDISELQMTQLVYMNKEFQKAVSSITGCFFNISKSAESLAEYAEKTIILPKSDAYNKNAKTPDTFFKATEQLLDCVEKTDFGFKKGQDDLNERKILLQNKAEELLQIYKNLQNKEKEFFRSNNLIIKLNPKNRQLLKHISMIMSEIGRNARWIYEPIMQESIRFEQLTCHKTIWNIAVKESLQTLINKAEAIDESYCSDFSKIEEQRNKLSKYRHELKNFTGEVIDNVQYFKHFEIAMKQIIEELKNISSSVLSEHDRKLSPAEEHLREIRKVYTTESERTLHDKFIDCNAITIGEVDEEGNDVEFF